MRDIKGFTLRNEVTKGFSLIEVLIFVSILSIFFVIAAAATVVSLRNMKISEHRILATHYAEELAEWLRNEKEADWTTFSAQPAGNYCFDISPISDWPGLGACGVSDYLTANSKSTIFFRNVLLQNPGSQMNVKVTVSWQDVGIDYQVPLATVFTRWED